MAPNKTLAAQLANEFRELLPNNAVEYFVSYYDYYQPEADVPQSDTYIEKDSSVSEEVERLRRSATNSLLTRRDVIVVASVSCIYGLGTPQEHVDRMVRAAGRRGARPGRAAAPLRRHPVHAQRHGASPAAPSGCAATPSRSSRSTRSWPSASRCSATRSRPCPRSTRSPARSSATTSSLYVFPASHYVAGPERLERAVNDIEKELAERLTELEKQGKLLEAQRLRMRTTYDIEMLRQISSCSGIENYSMHFDGRAPGSAPNTLLDYFPEDFLLIIDESHIDHPADWRACTRATPPASGPWSTTASVCPPRWTTARSSGRSSRAHRPDRVPVGHPGRRTSCSRADGGRPADHPPRQGWSIPRSPSSPPRARSTTWYDEIRKRTEKNERVLVTTLTKKMAEDLTNYLMEIGIQVRYLAHRHRHPAPRRAAARAAPRRLRRSGRHQPAARGPGPARGVACGDPRCRQGRLPALEHLPDPDHRARRP